MTIGNVERMYTMYTMYNGNVYNVERMKENIRYRICSYDFHYFHYILGIINFSNLNGVQGKLTLSNH